jgi:hypothetical protein
MPKGPEKRYSLVSRTTLPNDPNFDRKNYRLKHVYQEGGVLFFSYIHKNGENYLFEIYKDRDIKLEKPDFIKGVEKLRELYRKKQELEEKLKQSIDEKLDSTFEYQKLKELLEERPNSSFEHQRLQKWYKRTVIRTFYETIKFMGYEHEWPEISKMLPSIFKVSKEKMEIYTGKGTIAAYNRLFGELWSDKDYPNPFVIGGEMGAHVLKDYKNKGHNVKLNPLQKEHEEWVEEMDKLHLKNQMGDGIKRTSLSDKEIENIQTVMRFGPQDPHAGYYEADLELLEKIENSTPSERRKLLSYESYIEIIKNPKTRKKRFFTTLNMLNVMVGTHDFDEQTRNISVIRDLIIPKKG